MTSSALYHDVRGILAAASSNVEFLLAQEQSSDASPVLSEIAHELRIVADVIALLGSAEEDRVVEIDLRAVLFVARGARPFAIDATDPPFTVRARRSALVAYAAAMLDASTRGAGVRVSEKGCTVRGLDPGSLDSLRRFPVLAEAALLATVEDDALVLRHEN